jgi:hypothetical protein
MTVTNPKYDCNKLLSKPRIRISTPTPCDRKNAGKIYQKEIVKRQLKGEICGF